MIENKIISGETQEFEVGILSTYDDYYRNIIARIYRKRRKGQPPHINSVRTDISAKAIINHGRWIVKCPWCSGAEILYLSKPQFLCLSCFNKAGGSKFIKVDVPIFWKEIEAELLKRPLINRNYEHGETLQDLINENKVHGLEVKKWLG